MELVPRTTAPLHATGAVEFLPLAALAADATFRLREEGDVSALAASIARLGQLVPVEVRPLPGAPGDGGGGPRWQVVAGFRRVAAMRLLARQRVLARVHARLDDDDAWALALVPALLGEPLSVAELGALRDRLSASRAAPWAEELVDEALVRGPVSPELRERFLEFLSGRAAPSSAPAVAAAPAEEEPAPGEAPAGTAGPEEVTPGAAGPEEVTPEELAEGLAARLWEVNQDLSLAVDAWDDLPEEGRRVVLEQARYVAEIYPYLSGRRR